MACDAINLDEINSPVRIKPSDGQVVSLAGGSVRGDAVVVGVPRTSIRAIGSLRCMIVRVCNRQVPFDCLFGNSTQDMNAELQSKTMHIVCEGFETGSICR